MVMGRNGIAANEATLDRGWRGLEYLNPDRKYVTRRDHSFTSMLVEVLVEYRHADVNHGSCCALQVKATESRASSASIECYYATLQNGEVTEKANDQEKPLP